MGTIYERALENRISPKERRTENDLGQLLVGVVYQDGRTVRTGGEMFETKRKVTVVAMFMKKFQITGGKMSMRKYLQCLLVGFVLSIMFLGMSGTVVYAGSSSLLPNVNSSYYIKGYCYGVHDTDKKRVHVYGDENCTQRNTNEYIDAKNDECRIIQTSDSTDNIGVSYPAGKRRKERWTTIRVFTFANTYSVKYATARISTYKFGSSSYGYGSISKNDEVRVYETRNGYVRVLYPIYGGYKFAWVKTSDADKYLSSTRTTEKNSNQTSNNSTFYNKVGQTVANISSYYYTNGNMSYNAGYKGQCTWYAYGRFYEVNGIALKSARNAKYWLSENKGDRRVKVTSVIQPKSIAVRTTGKYGHVMFVEDVVYENGLRYVYFTECNTDGNGRYDPGKDCIVKKLSYSNFVSQKNPSGYIVKQ